MRDSIRNCYVALSLLLLCVNNGLCIRNLFIPRTGDININQIIEENLSNVTNFQSLLGAGRSLAYPFAAGVLISIATLANENNWKVSDAGFSQAIGVPRHEILESYGTLLEMLETDENVTVSNMMFSFRPNFSPSEELTETMMTEVREVTWTRETWRDTYNIMVEHLSNVTNEKIDTQLIPPVTKIGTPFRKSTEAVLLSTFHYINGWQYPWMDSEIGSFQDSEGIPYLKTEGNFMVAEQDEFTAVAVPLEGGAKNIVFVLPHANISSKYFRTQPEEGEKENADTVPFPKNWEMKKLRLKVPTFNTSDVDQYGQELEQIGMNETFCTIIRDYFGRYPYYMRPMVQVNFLDFNEDFLELASATGVAVEQFQSFFSTILGDKKVENDDDERRKQSNDKAQSFESTLARAGIKGRLLPEDSSNSNSSPVGDKSVFISLDDSTSAESDIPTISFNRPFLWYLNDTDVGPMFFGTVEILLNLALVENSTEIPPPPGGEDEMTTMLPPPSTGNGENNSTNAHETDINTILMELEKYYLWSCRSFIPSSGGSNNTNSTLDGKGMLEIPLAFSFSDDENVAATTVLSQQPS